MNRKWNKRERITELMELRSTYLSLMLLLECLPYPVLRLVPDPRYLAKHLLSANIIRPISVAHACLIQCETIHMSYLPFSYR